MTEVEEVSTSDLEKLSVEELETLLEIKKREALKRKKFVVDKCLDILKAFGKEIPKKHGAYHEYDSKGLKLVWDDYGGTIDVYWRGMHVFCSHEVSFRYNPGTWELLLDKLSKQANRVLEEREAEKRKQELLSELKKFLDVEDDDVKPFGDNLVDVSELVADAVREGYCLVCGHPDSVHDDSMASEGIVYCNECQDYCLHPDKEG